MSGMTMVGDTQPETDGSHDIHGHGFLDAQGNLTVNNALCEGIDSAKLPVKAPQF
jgi:hypothetical protein